MGAGCDIARDFAILWEEQGESDALKAGLGGFKAHLTTCPDCRKKYGPMLALMERDAAVRLESAPDADFVERVMRAIPDPSGGYVAHRNRAFLPAIAAAAAVILVLGGLALSRAGLFSKEARTVAIHFTLDAPNASSVVLVGSFSDWAVDDRFRLRRVDAGSWELYVDLRKDALYSYGFLVDGEKWLADPRASETVDDGFGGNNSLLRL